MSQPHACVSFPCPACSEAIKAAMMDYVGVQSYGIKPDSLLALLCELRDYTARLEHASAAWFATRSYAKRPEIGDLRERLDAILGPWEPT